MDKATKIKNLRESVRQMERKLGILEESEVSCHGISLAQCHALVEIGRAKSISLIELSELLNLDSSTMSRTVNNLVNNGMAGRELDSNDRRYVTIKLTENGLKKFMRIEDNMNLYFTNIFESIPCEKQEQVLESLQILVAAIAKNDQ
ncbi:hypothetical protein SDC9_83139 [bioreactor metagenome]|uniref:HTH marR-type domain-containing protein n=1 Tax=bioreactor metagenome TaxID=1076179 RepID=A0A644Z977_9ZZZZ|nr:MarR family transcriptional regulator [Oscillibacter sp.]